ncbi:metallophosphoesterase [Sphingomonas lutea]
MFSRKPAYPSGPPNYRAYVIGDVHGRLDLLEQLLGRIEADMSARKNADIVLAFVGDLIDRGPSSAQVVERLRNYGHEGVRTVFLLGNHEEVLLRILAGEDDLINGWLRFGGAECLRSYGEEPGEIRSLSADHALARIRAAIPEEHKTFLESFGDTFKFGDYLFVHAGVRPGVDLDSQLQKDLRWIRDPFLLHEGDHGFVVVHGHTICKEVEERPNRIGIDTGAYATGVLTALAIDQGKRWFIDTRQSAGAPIPAAH